MSLDAKTALRRRLRTHLRAFAPGYRAQASAAICARLNPFLQLPPNRAVLVFLPLPSEPDITPFLRRLLLSGRRVYAPALAEARVKDSGEAPSYPAPEPLQWRRLLNLDQLNRGPGGFRQPKTSPSPPPPNALVLVPGLAYTRAGQRLGRGGGHYDQFLAGHAGIRVGVCFHRQLLPSIPVQPHDQSVTCVLTELATFPGCREQNNVHR